MPRFAITVLAASAIGIALFGVVAEDADSGRSWLGAWLNSCKIKGNISATGEHIYHVPGQTYYHATWVSAAGERWFCSEAEAQREGWRRAKL
jgi:hypothetical protein